jgi:hypothetical protein
LVGLSAVDLSGAAGASSGAAAVWQVEPGLLCCVEDVGVTCHEKVNLILLSHGPHVALDPVLALSASIRRHIFLECKSAWDSFVLATSCVSAAKLVASRLQTIIQLEQSTKPG